MSYDVYLQIDTGAEYPATVYEVGNYTSNVSRMWTTALGHPLYELNDRNAGEAVAVLDEAIGRMHAGADEYQAMNPANGWGDYAGALKYLRRLREGCAQHPKTVIHVSH